MNGPQSGSSSDKTPQQAYNREDDVRFVDLWIVLVKRKLVIALILVLSISLGGGVIFLLPEKYKYITALEIGKNMTNGEVQVIEKPETLLVKVGETYIPKVQHQFANETGSGKYYAIKALSPTGSQVILLESKGKSDEEEIYAKLHEEILSLVIEDHAILLNKFRSALEKKRSELLNKIDSSGINLLQKQLTDIRKSINENKVDNLELKVKEKMYQNRVVQDQIDLIDLELVNLKETKALDKTMRSIKPIDIPKIMIAVLSVVLGLMAGIFGALFVEFVSKVKKEMSEI